MGDTWIVAGVTQSVNLEKNIIRVWLDSPEGEYDTPITEDMPDWLLQPDVSFKTIIPRACVRNGNLDGVEWDEFSVMPYASLTEDELWDEFGKLFEPPDPTA